MVQKKTARNQVSQPILDLLQTGEKTRKELIDSLPFTPSGIDANLQKLLRQDKIQYRVEDQRHYRASGIQNFVCISNPKVRVYSIKKLEDQKEKKLNE